MKYILGIDVGTTGTKTLLFSTDGKLKGRAYRGYSLITPTVGFKEQNADDWWNAVTETVRELCSDKTIAQNVIAISLSTQGGTMVPVDAACNALRPAIVWNDSRAVEQKEMFEQTLGGDDTMYNITGWHLGKSLPALAIRWLNENEPEIFLRSKYFLTVPDYISMKMTGIPAVDVSNAGINQLCNIKQRTYDERLLEFSGIKETQLGNIVQSGDIIGQLTKEAANEMGLTTNTVLIAGAHDQYAVSLGAGAFNAGSILIGSGTCWVLTCINDTPDFESGLSQSVAASPGKWGSIQSLSSGGVCLDWFRKIISQGEEISYEVLNKELSRRKAAEDGLFFYPFSGKASATKRFQRASFVGMDLSHDCFNLALAVMEGVVFQILWMMESFNIKQSKEGLILSGGASKSPVWAQLVADISGMPVRIPEVADLACVGAAIMAGVGSGIYDSVEKAYPLFSVKEQVLQPDMDKHQRFISIFNTYKNNAPIHD